MSELLVNDRNLWALTKKTSAYELSQQAFFQRAITFLMWYAQTHELRFPELAEVIYTRNKLVRIFENEWDCDNTNASKRIEVGEHVYNGFTRGLQDVSTVTADDFNLLVNEGSVNNPHIQDQYIRPFVQWVQQDGLTYGSLLRLLFDKIFIYSYISDRAQDRNDQELSLFQTYIFGTVTNDFQFMPSIMDNNPSAGLTEFYDETQDITQMQKERFPGSQPRLLRNLFRLEQ